MKKIKGLNKILCILTLLSPIISFVLICKIGEVNIFGHVGIVRYSWIMLLFIPIGILTIIIGIKLKRAKQNYKENFIIAFISISFLIIFGSYSLIFAEVVSDNSVVNLIENETELKLPDKVTIVTDKMDSYNVSYLKINNNDSRILFEREIKDNKLWKNELGTKLKSLLPYEIQIKVDEFEYFVFYNVTIKQYNIYPPDGVSKIIFIAYDADLNKLIIVDDYIINLY